MLSLVCFTFLGVCMADQHPCEFQEDDCYPVNKQCDREWDCPLRGGDERGCGKITTTTKGSECIETFFVENCFEIYITTVELHTEYR